MSAKRPAKVVKKLAKGKTKAMGGTPHKMSKPELGIGGKLKGGMKKGRKTAARKGKSPLDGRGKK